MAMEIKGRLRIGTRGSDLALKQTHGVAERLKEKFPGLLVEITVIKTKGDIMQDVSLVKIGGKGVFVREIEEALLRDEIDIAVHSMKDVPVELPDGLEIGAMTEREDPRDVLISRDGRKLDELPHGARIGTGSLRRGFQMKNLLPAIEIVPLRGNLNTRIRKVETDNLDGVVVAAAGIRRMGWVHRVSQFIPVEMMLPAAGQGAIGIELRRDDKRVRDTVSFINHPSSWLEVTAERSFLNGLGGGCRLPIAAYGKRHGDDLVLMGLVGDKDGRVMIRDTVRGRIEEGEALGKKLADNISSRGGREILESVISHKS
ncbi:MAG: hydroxymethylbilane synthase [Syntrophales bacterium]|nr:hydroxymethylbilane synthase [Syntrophales bacterium]